MSGEAKIKALYPESFIANKYSKDPFRMIGLIDVDINFKGDIERVTLAYYRSSGTNNGKIQGLWYPIVGIKLYTGKFTEFTPFINNILANTTYNHMADRGWLCKSLFFEDYINGNMINGFSKGKHYKRLLEIGKILRAFYENGKYISSYALTPSRFNEIIYSKNVYDNNKNSQRKNFEKIIRDIV